MTATQTIIDKIQRASDNTSFQEALCLYYELESNPIFESAIRAKKDAIVAAYTNKNPALLIQELKSIVLTINAPTQVLQSEAVFDSQEPTLHPTVRSEHAALAQEAIVKIEEKKEPRRSFIKRLVARFSQTREIPKEQMREVVSRAVLDSPDPLITINMVKESAMPITKQLLKKASTASSFAVLFSASDDVATQTKPHVFQHLAFLSNSPIGTVVAPLADSFIGGMSKEKQLFFLGTFFSSSWEKINSSPKWQQELGRALFETEFVKKIISQGNQLFGTRSQSTTLLSPVQIFVSDVFVTIFRPQVSELYLRLSGWIGQQQKTALPLPWYMSLITNAAFQKTGEKIITSTGIGAWLGTVIGGPLGTFVGGIINGAVVEKIKRGVSGFFNFLSLQSLTNLFNGDVNSTPVWKDSSFIIAAVLVGIVVILSGAIPILGSFGIVSSILPSSERHVTVDDNALIQGLAQSSFEDTGSKYIKITKIPSQSTVGNNSSSSIVYTITVSATEVDLSNVTIEDVFSGFSQNGTLPFTQPKKAAGISIPVSQPFTTTVTLPLSSLYNDSVIINTITVIADAGLQTGETRLESASVIVGSPPTACFVKRDSGPADGCGSGGTPSTWSQTDWGKVVASIGQLSRSPEYIKLLCGTKDAPKPIIPVYSVTNSRFEGGCFTNPGIYLYFPNVALPYTFAHETGHALAKRSPATYNLFLSEAPTAREGRLETYGGTLKSNSEDFAESIGLYVGHTSYYPNSWRSLSKQYPADYPLHYFFTKTLFGGVEY